MSIRVRQKGDRRRASGSTLVRTLPSFRHVPPPIPAEGSITRAVYAESISDYESLSTASWSTGTTGFTTDFHANCLYHHYTTTDRRTVPVDNILNPIRWYMAMPTTNGGTYDRWAKSRDFGASSLSVPTLNDGRYQHALDFALYASNIAPVHTLLVSGSHAEFRDGHADLTGRPLPILCPWNTLVDGVWPPNLQSISALPAWANSTFCTIHAARHYVNGVAVGPTEINPGPDFWRFAVAEGDEYYLDVWYRIYSTTNTQTGPGKACAFIPLTRVSDGSRMIRTQVNSNLSWLPNLTFSNVDFSPAFNYKEQTFQITIAGHTGWTLKDGTDGPHKMLTDTPWTAVIQNGFIRWIAPGSHYYVKRFDFNWAQEIPYLYLYGTENLTAHSGPLIYKPRSDGTYRSSTVATGIGTINHAPMGRFAQSGTTTFDLVPWSNLPYVAANMDGFKSGLIPTSPLLPSTITVTRTTQ
jgi:hypothetical protein